MFSLKKDFVVDLFPKNQKTLSHFLPVFLLSHLNITTFSGAIKGKKWEEKQDLKVTLLG